MFQNIVNATEPMADEKEAINFVSNNPTRKEIIMYVFKQKRVQLLRKLSSLLYNIYLREALCSNRPLRAVSISSIFCPLTVCLSPAGP